MSRLLTVSLISGILLSVSAMANPDPIEQRQDLMKKTGKAAKAIGNMLKEKDPFDASAAMESLLAWQKTATEVGVLFPEGSESGHDTEAKSDIWTDRAGFDEKLADFKNSADAAVAANPATLAELDKAAGPVFKTCKGCHETYRVEKD